jgi:oligopeptide/dipeptide ABC transporter ATP-binding protein
MRSRAGKVNVIEVRNLTKYYPVRKGLFSRSEQFVKAVDGVSFDLKEGETLGLVGESGCGKTTTGRCILRLIEPTSGEVKFLGNDLLKLERSQMRTMRRQMQMIFQDPYASLNQRMTVGSIIEEPLIIHRTGGKKERLARVADLLKMVGLDPSSIKRYPHEFSGGQRQRIGIARALALNPKLIIADEPVSALDVSVQAQIINLLKDLQQKLQLTFLFIAHDLSVVYCFSDRIGVMYLGKIAELAPSVDLFQTPLHPYTKILLTSIPIPDPSLKRKRESMKDEIPTPIDPPAGCRFHLRCPIAVEQCRTVEPVLREIQPGHFVACHLV